MSVPLNKDHIVRNIFFRHFLQVSFNSDKDIDLRSSGGPIVYQGFRLKGVLDLFGYQIKAHIIYSERVSSVPIY